MRPLLHVPFVRVLALPGVLAAALAGPALAAPNSASSCGAAGPARLSVSGQGQSRIAPDMAAVQLGVTTQGPSAAEAMTRNSDQQRAVIEALTGAGIEEAQIQTFGLTLNPLMRYEEGQSPTITGYEARNVISVRISDLPRVGEVLDAIVAAGANEISGIEFTREDADEALDDARRDAVADARRRAEVLAEASGLSLGPVIALRDVPADHGGPRPLMRMEAAMADSTPVQPGQLELRAHVEIDYALGGENACAPMPRGRMHHGHQHHHGNTSSDAEEVVPPMPGDAAPAPDEPLAPGIVEPLPNGPSN